MNLTTPTALCPHCQNELVKGSQVTEGYTYACLECDEDFYSVEIKQYKEGA